MPEKDTRWLVLIGAMLANKQTREDAGKLLSSNDVPPPLKGLWQAIIANRGEEVWSQASAIGVGNRSAASETILACLIRGLQETALDDFCRLVVDRSAFSKGVLSADAVAGALEGWAQQIRAKQAALGKA